MLHMLYVGTLKFPGMSMVSPSNGDVAICTVDKVLWMDGDTMVIKHDLWLESVEIDLSMVLDWVLVEDDTL